MEVRDLPLPGLKLITPRVFPDSRGFFVETWHRDRYADAGIAVQFVQDNRSHSSRGTLRGLHYQLPHQQGKLVSVTGGAVFDVAVDIRQGSPTFGRWHGEVLDDRNHRQLYLPPGLAHGFLVLSATADVVYKCTDSYHPAAERGVRWSDPAIAIDWPTAGIDDLTISDKDAALPTLAEVANDDLPTY